MLKSLIFILLITAFPTLLFAQADAVSGEVADPEGAPLVYASVTLLKPADSTLQYFCITNPKGYFEIRNIKTGTYLMQLSYLGFKTHYREVKIPRQGGSEMGIIILQPAPVGISEVQVTGERIPLVMNRDTLEFNAAAFQLKSGAVTEDLLKKLPGLEIDRAGNIKALGEDVNRVFVDGKEFFGNDPKVATKNIPASAVDKVQVYDRKSDNAMFTGISDGWREKAINLKLQEESKQALFGSLEAGGGTSDAYQGSARVYRFNDKIQLAGLGMLNNVNQTGFSMDDYLNFSGGAVRMLSGGGSAQIRITNDGSFPVNFGTPVSGLTTSGAGGLNFSRSAGPNNRTFISYLGNGSEKELEQTTISTNYLQDKDFNQSERLREKQRNDAHRFNFGIRNRIDSLQNLNLNGNLSFASGKGERGVTSASTQDNLPVNLLGSWSDNRLGRMAGDVSGSYIRKVRSNHTIWDLSGNASFSRGGDDTEMENETYYFGTGKSIITSLFQENRNSAANWAVSTSLTQRIGKQLYLEPSIRVGGNFDLLDRQMGIPPSDNHGIDSLSARVEKHYLFARPGLNLSHNRDRVRLSLSLAAESGQLSSHRDGEEMSERSLFYLLPSLSYENEYKTGKRIMVNYSSSLNTPATSQLFPLPNVLNPLVVVRGNPDLKPEYLHRANLHWVWFDQFSFTSIFAGLNATVIRDKISWERTINEQLQQVNSYFNADRDFSSGGNASLSTPLRSLGIQLSLNAEERYTRGMSRINGKENEFTNWINRFSFSGGNRRKEKVDLNAGIEFTYTKSGYSVQKELNNEYTDISWFADFRYTPDKKWDFEANADITRYTERSFGDLVIVPLIGGEMSRHFMSNNRATLTLRAFDLLNRNKTVQRLSEINYLREIRSNSIGRFIMLSFTYRLNRFGSQPGGVHVEMRSNRSL